MRTTLGMMAIWLVLGAATRLDAQRFYPDDPMLEDDDRLVDVVVQPEEVELSDMFDRIGHIFHTFGDPPYPAFTEAQNVNTLDEVPDSSWFVNRHGRERRSLDALRQGSNADGPPDPNQTWTIFMGKSQGTTPGFSTFDERGDRYVIKFDPVEIPELATAAEAIGTRIFHALGYHVPQNYIVRFNPDNFAIEPGTMVEDSWGDQVALSEGRVQRMIRRVPRDAQGRMRVMASKYIEGAPMGPFRYYGTRSDDANDVIPHEHRRELRGLRLFAAWTNHDDTRAQNTQASWVSADGTHHVRHWLIDFGSTFGSGSVDLQLPNLSFHYWLPLDQVRRSMVGFGVHAPTYRNVEWPDFPEYAAVGRWEAEAFDPMAWRNDYPNPAFLRMTPRDAFWAAKTLMRFTSDELLAIVQTGEFSDPEHERYFHDVLVTRQRKTGEAGITLLNPLDEFDVSGETLEFANLSERYGFVAPNSTTYRVTWSLYDNTAATVREELVAPATLTDTRDALPDPARHRTDRNLLLRAELSSHQPDYPHWDRPIRVYLRSDGTRYDVVGIERESPQEYVGMP